MGDRKGLSVNGKREVKQLTKRDSRIYRRNVALSENLEQIVYIQADQNGLPYSVNGMAAAKGFAFLGYTVRFFYPSDLPTLPLSPGTIVVGGVGTVRDALQQIGVHTPSHTSVPAILYPYLGRECWRTTIEEVRKAGRFPIFLKPFEQAKAFSGLVVRDLNAFERLLAPRPDFPAITEDFPVLAQEPVVFKSEWRVFVVRRVILGVSFYQGDPLLFPSAGVIRVAVGAYQNAPAGYSADFGVTDDGRTLLVETNDGYSLGHGGLTANLYAELLLSRWKEMTTA